MTSGPDSPQQTIAHSSDKKTVRCGIQCHSPRGAQVCCVLLPDSRHRVPRRLTASHPTPGVRSSRALCPSCACPCNETDSYVCTTTTTKNAWLRPQGAHVCHTHAPDIHTSHMCRPLSLPYSSDTIRAIVSTTIHRMYTATNRYLQQYTQTHRGTQGGHTSLSLGIGGTQRNS